MIRCAAVLLLVGTTFCGALAEEPFSELRIMQDDQYPKVFFFRSSEKIGRGDTVKYNAWDRDFSQLMGIMGKVLNNELLDITERGSESFTRFKKEHPNQIVLCHYNGNARDPRHERQFCFDGHWMYYNGAKITEALRRRTLLRTGPVQP
jgi:hypothetical protein